ncbi:MAG: phosphodiester glycosidase family protein [Armatimonadetes bacterium]|nr:phosphodiester glycosidase family protein [Armatimonadota bacterium]
MIKNLWITFLVGLMLPGACSASSIAYSRVKVGRTVAHVVTADLANREVRVSVALARGGAGSQETFKSIIGRARPAAAITGTFFDTRTLIPTGDIAVFGTIVHSGCIGAALCVDSNNVPAMVPLRAGRQCGWTGYETVLCAGPTLISQGRISISLKREGFRRSLCAPARRTAVGITKSGKLLIVAINRSASLHDLARLMLKLNAKDAVCLDGGSSTAFYYQGRYLATPGRRLTNCLVIYSSSSKYNSAKPAIAPARYFATAHTSPGPVHLSDLITRIPVAPEAVVTPSIKQAR